MKSEVSPDAPKKQESLKGVLLNPEPIGAAKTFPSDVDMISSKVGNEFSHLCSDSNKQPRSLNGGTEQEKGLVRKKRKSQQAGPSYAQSCEAKKNQRLIELRLGPQTDEDNDSSFSDCVSSPSSSSHFGDSDTMTSDEDKDSSRHFSPTVVNTTNRTPPPSRAQKWPRSQSESVPSMLMKRPCYQVSALRRSVHRKTFVKKGSTQRTQKQKERLLLQRKKREVLARKKYALLPSSSSSSENDLSSESASSTSSSTEGEEDIFLSPEENHQNGTTLPSGHVSFNHLRTARRCHTAMRPGLLALAQIVARQHCQDYHLVVLSIHLVEDPHRILMSWDILILVVIHHIVTTFHTIIITTITLLLSPCHLLSQSLSVLWKEMLLPLHLVDQQAALPPPIMTRCIRGWRGRETAVNYSEMSSQINHFRIVRLFFQHSQKTYHAGMDKKARGLTGSPDASLTRPLHHQTPACPHSHANPPPQPPPPPQMDYVIAHPVAPFHPSLPSLSSTHPVPPPPPSHHFTSAAAPLSQHLSTTHLSHHISATAPTTQRLHPHEVIQRMEVQRRRLMQHPTRAHERPPPHPHRMHPNYGHGHHIHVPQTMSSHPRQASDRSAWEIAIETGVTAAPYQTGPLHPHLAHYHPPPRLHHLQIGALPLMVPDMAGYPHIRYISSGLDGRSFRVPFRGNFEELIHLEERLGNVNRGATQGTIERCTYPHKYKKVIRQNFNIPLCDVCSFYCSILCVVACICCILVYATEENYLSMNYHF
ncbi:hypothetical protein AB205_0141900 [Aquarana catesbeiana]|uniref:E3 ubiquitin-protein ligase Arkadia N-terminal domain-containing protein n=2 Tax=Aquarana catesbeiana TaxID=8400 RepID=A0A2G9RYR8_AQUCT|nr:hypothetical protein AB205_0141900 [Aquarana catesbeiana]